MSRVSILALSLSPLLLAPALATADTRITSEERTQMKGGERDTDQTTEAVLWFGPDRAARILPRGRLISRLDRGEAYLVDDTKKTYTVIRMEDKAPPLEIPTVRRSGETRQVGAWSAERYDLDFEVPPGEAGHAVLWMSTDVDVDLDVYRAYARSVARAMGMGWIQAIAELDGYPVLQETTMGPVRVTTRLVSIAEEEPPPGLYEPPADYARQD
jgi:hypothetical protein